MDHLDLENEEIEFSNDEVIEVGKLLIASPVLQDSNFRKTVLLLCEHSDQGSFGLILNRPMQTALSDVLNISSWDTSLFQGGPVQMTSLHYVHNQLLSVAGSRKIIQDVGWGGKFEDLEDLINSNEINEIDYKFFIGYAGWASGQLENEIEQKSWFLTDLNQELLFKCDPSEIWDKAIRGLGAKYEILLTYPKDPNYN